MLHLDTGNTGFMILVHQPGHADDAGPRILLRRPGGPQERPGHHDSKLRLHGLDHGHLVPLWIFAVLQRRLARSHRQLPQRFPARHRSQHAIAATTRFPLFVFIAYQMMFAIITPALISGAFTNRVTFKAYMLFLTGWLTFVYFPFVHMVWGGGFLQQWGVKDFAGGIVVHNIAGMAALASVLYVGKRRVLDRGPHSIPLVALGTGLLWFGWYGFNAGSEMRVDSVTATAFLNTDVAASFAAVAWLLVAWLNEKKPKFLGLLTGAVAGLATVTPAAGYVSPTTAVIIGIVSGVVCYYAVEMKNKLQLGRRARCLGSSRCRRIPRHRHARHLRQQSSSIPRAPMACSTAIRSSSEAGDGGCLLLGLGIRVHLRHAAHHRCLHHRQGQRDVRGDRPRRIAPRRARLRATHGSRRDP